MFTYKDAVEYLDSFVNYEREGLELLKGRFDLGKLRRALKRAGDPQRSYRSIHIAGTKGKGSVSVFTSFMLKEAGYRVGLFTSPHLVTPRERISINNKVISKIDLVKTAEELRGVIGARPAFNRFSFFEVYTMLAMLYFRTQKVDYAVFECGLGGRLDATNVIDAAVCGFSPISYDHMHLLGRRIDEIAAEKTAIIKKGAHCVSSPQKPAALRVIRNKCREKKASLSVTGKDITYRLRESGEKGVYFDIFGKKGHYKGCHTRMLGDFQVENCATAVGICEAIGDMPAGDVSPAGMSPVKRGIARAFLPGRIEVLCRRPRLVIDGAQNSDSAARLKYSVEQIFTYDKLILLLGLSRDKDIKGVCRELLPLADEVIITRASVKRAADPCLIKGYIKGRKVRIAENVKEALGLAFSRAGKNDLILATGSFFLIGEIRELIRGHSL